MPEQTDGPTEAESSPRYRPDIDGLRAIAVSAVVFFHTGLIRSGFVGVDIFFVISGYLIGGIVYRDTTRGSFSFAAFYARRARRIFPALLVVVFATLAVSSLVMSPAELKHLSVSAMATLAAISNIRFWKGTSYFSPDAHLDPMLMTWSLGVEEQFYIFFPFIMIALRRLRPTALLLSLAALVGFSLLLSVFLTAKAPTAAFYLLPTRAWELGLGALLAIWNTQHRPRVTGGAADAAGIVSLVALGVSIFAFSETTPFPGVAAVLPVVATVALIASEGSWVNRVLLGHAVPVWIGRFSYSWYLWHWPLLALARVCSISQPSSLILTVIGLLSLGLGALSWRFIERPFRRVKLPAFAVIPRYAGIVIAGVLVSGALWRIEGALAKGPGPVNESQRALDLQEYYPCLASWPSQVPNESSACVQSGARGGIAILGDSHAAALGPAIQALALARGWGSLVLTKSSCRPLIETSVWRADQPLLVETCSRFNDAAFARVANDPGVSTVVLAGLWAGPFAGAGERYVRYGGKVSTVPAFEAGLRDAAAMLRARGKRVIIVEDVPYWTFDPRRALLASELPARGAVSRLVSQADYEQLAKGIGPVAPRSTVASLILHRVATSTGSELIDLNQAFCLPKCRYRDGAKIYYIDHSHLSATGAMTALRSVAPLLFK